MFEYSNSVNVHGLLELRNSALYSIAEPFILREVMWAVATAMTSAGWNYVLKSISKSEKLLGNPLVASSYSLVRAAAHSPAIPPQHWVSIRQILTSLSVIPSIQYFIFIWLGLIHFLK